MGSNPDLVMGVNFSVQTIPSAQVAQPLDSECLFLWCQTLNIGTNINSGCTT